MATPRDVLASDHSHASALVRDAGIVKTRFLLRKAARDLERRLMQAELGPGPESFTATRLRATLAQVRIVLKNLNGGMKTTLLGVASDAGEKSAQTVHRYMSAAQKRYAGAVEPLALKEASLVDAATKGAQASILRRLASSGENVPGAEATPHRAKLGILDRYGLETVGHFEEILQRSIVTRAPWDDVRSELVERSPFLQGAPAHWAERIVRTESMGIYNRAAWESVREADDQLGDMLKILSATFDERTAADSYAVHGQIRRPDEAFQSWYGLYQHPPNRPNDREVVVPHRKSWPIPPYLAWRSDGEIAARWRHEGRKGRPPARPKMTTVPLSEIGPQRR